MANARISTDSRQLDGNSFRPIRFSSPTRPRTKKANLTTPHRQHLASFFRGIGCIDFTQLLVPLTCVGLFHRGEQNSLAALGRYNCAKQSLGRAADPARILQYR